MPCNLISNTLATIKGEFGPQVVNNDLNPIHLAVATRGYRIQSHKLYIPDRFGFFSPGPPRLHVYQGGTFIVLASLSSFFIVMTGFAILSAGLILSGRPYFVFAAAFSAYVAAWLGLIWVLACVGRPPRHWKDWKLRKL